MKKLHFRAVMAVFAAFLMIFMTACSGKEMSLDTIDPSAYVTLPEYKGLKIEKIDVSVSEGDIEAAVMNDLDGFAEEKDVDDRPVLDGDTVNINYEGKIDGKTFEGGSGNTYLEIGSDTFIDGFEDGVIGMEIDETKELKLRFPDDYKEEDLAGKDVVFTVTVNSIREKVAPAITEDGVLEKLSEKYEGEEFKEVEDYFGYIKEHLEESKAEDAENKYRTDLLQQVYDGATCELEKLPEWLVSQNTTEYMNSMESYASQYGITLDDYLSLISGNMTEFTEQAWDYGKELSKQQLVIRAIAKAENIDVTDEELQTYYRERAEEYGTTVDVLKKSVDEDTIRQYLLSEEVREFLYDNAKIE